jgi:hypothetical protein
MIIGYERLQLSYELQLPSCKLTFRCGQPISKSLEPRVSPWVFQIWAPYCRTGAVKACIQTLSIAPEDHSKTMMASRYVKLILK